VSTSYHLRYIYRVTPCHLRVNTKSAPSQHQVSTESTPFHCRVAYGLDMVCDLGRGCLSDETTGGYWGGVSGDVWVV
ncbi:MAG: hypothetical protein K5867_02475, partial [Bacteroidales bacterium]|nr:hypothetical protein [Bacteroidales bacterium]